MIHDTLRGILLFGPCSLPRSLLWSLALRVLCAPWPLSVCPRSPAHGTQQCAGHPLPSPRPCLPSPTPAGRFRFLSCSLPLCAHGAEHPHPFASLPLVVCALGVPRFPLLSPVPRLCYPSPALETLQASCTHVTLHPPEAFYLLRRTPWAPRALGSLASCLLLPVLPLPLRCVLCRAVCEASLPLPLHLSAPWCPGLLASCMHVALHPPAAFFPLRPPRLPLPPLPFSPSDTMQDTV